jgi:hypothetical protein
MNVRRAADWQRSVDDRILEHLAEEPWSSPRHMTSLPSVHATEAQVRDRCCRLADVGLVAWIDDETLDLIELTTEGRLYLDGELDVDLYPDPRPSREY